MIARVSRVLPLIIVLALLAAIAYLVVSYRHSPSRAKEVLIKMFTFITGGLSAAFVLVAAYALADGNQLIFDLALSFLAVTALGLVVTRICRAVFLRHHPSYRIPASKTTRPGPRPWRRRKR